MKKKRETTPIKSDDHVLCFSANLSSVVDVQAAFRDAVQRLRGIFVDRILGFGQVSLTESDKKLLQGVLEILVPPGNTVTLVAEPLSVFHPEKIVLDDQSADNFSVYDVKVGQNSQFLNGATPLPGTLFRHGVSQVIRMDTAQIGLRVTVTLTNTSTTPQPIPRVTMFGKIPTRE